MKQMPPAAACATAAVAGPRADALLIDAGPSPAGWSEIGRFIVCPRMAALSAIGALPQTRDATTWGSMGHSGLAHACAQASLDAGRVDDIEVGTREGSLRVWASDALLPPAEAATAWVRANGGEGSFMLPEVHGMLEEFTHRAGAESGFPGLRPAHEVIIAVESPVVAVVGHHEHGGFGLWVIDVPATIGHRAAGFEVATDWIRGRRALPLVYISALDSRIISIPNACMGPWERPIFFTRRIDLVRRLRDGSVEIIDHKCLAHPEPADARGVYAVDRGMQSFHVLGRQIYGSAFAGVSLHLVGKRPDKKTGKRRISVEPVPAVPLQIETMARRLYRAHWQRAELIDEQIPAALWDDSGADVGACKHRYGRCDALEPICSHWDVSRARGLGPVPRPYGLGTPQADAGALPSASPRRRS